MVMEFPVSSSARRGAGRGALARASRWNTGEGGEGAMAYPRHDFYVVHQRDVEGVEGVEGSSWARTGAGGRTRVYARACAYTPLYPLHPRQVEE
jgi:hypothetical protein